MYVDPRAGNVQFLPLCDAFINGMAKANGHSKATYRSNFANPAVRRLLEGRSVLEAARMDAEVKTLLNSTLGRSPVRQRGPRRGPPRASQHQPGTRARQHRNHVAFLHPRLSQRRAAHIGALMNTRWAGRRRHRAVTPAQPEGPAGAPHPAPPSHAGNNGKAVTHAIARTFRYLPRYRRDMLNLSMGRHLPQIWCGQKCEGLRWQRARRSEAWSLMTRCRHQKLMSAGSTRP
jgi:hypothetical protein